MRNAGVAARVAPEHSESRWATDRALDFIAEQGAERWCLHLSYIKPHWPYIAPAPYHKMYGREDMLDVIRSPKELEDAHPVVAGFRNFKPSVSFQREGVRETVVPTYMGLVREIDDQIGRLLEALRASGRLDDTLVVFCSDHGDYLGDHYLGDKELFHDTVARVPMLVVDPRRAADATRGSASDRLVEAIDVVPTILDALGLPIADHIVEGRSLVPVLEASPGPWRDAAISEMTYAFRDVVRLPIGRPVSGCQSYMVRTGRWKANFYGGLRPELFDMSEDPHELHDLGGDPSRAGVIAELETLLVDWTRERNIHPTMPNATIAGWNKKEVEVGIEIGTW
jgi:arylsulfatase A-like enzyme